MKNKKNYVCLDLSHEINELNAKIYSMQEDLESVIEYLECVEERLENYQLNIIEE